MSSLIIHVFYLLWRNFKSLSPHIHFLVNVDTGDDEEDPRPPGSSSQQPAQPEDDGPLVLLDHLHHEDQTERKRRHDQHQGEYGEGQGADTGTLLTGCNGKVSGG